MEPDRISALAKLSQLDLTDAERERASRQITQLLAHFDALADLDLEGVEPSPYPRPIVLRPRPDVAAEPLPTDSVLANAPSTRAGQFSVPKVIDA